MSAARPITPGVRDARKLVPALEEDYDSAEAAALAILEKAWELYEDKARWTVVGQARRRAGQRVENGDKVALGRYPTETTARHAAEQMAFATATGEEFAVWVLPVHHGTPAQYFTKRKEALEKERDEAEAEQREERFSRAGTRSMAAALADEARRNGWLTREETEHKAETCPECGTPLEEADPLVGGYAVEEAS